MRKLILSAALAVMSLASLNAQEGLKAGAHIGVPVGDATDYLGVNFGAEVSYLYPIMENLHVGGIAGLDIFTGKDEPGTIYKKKSLTVLPIAASAQYDFLDQFFAGVDLGYAFSLSKGYDGGFYFQPKGGWQNEYFQAFVFIKTFGSGIDATEIPHRNFSGITTIGVGGAYKF